MDIKYNGHSRRKKEAMDFWLRVAADNNNGIPAEKIAKRYTNPKTQKPYTREHIYFILRKLSLMSPKA